MGYHYSCLTQRCYQSLQFQIALPDLKNPFIVLVFKVSVVESHPSGLETILSSCLSLGASVVESHPSGLWSILSSCLSLGASVVESHPSGLVSNLRSHNYLGCGLTYLNETQMMFCHLILGMTKNSTV
mgnify:CR=1 FL=1